MYGRHESQITPRNGSGLVVGIVARISGCANQKELSLEDQVDHAKQLVDELYEGHVHYRTITTRGKGERLDRPELVEIEEMLRTRELDLLVVEDIGRMVRGTEAARLCGIAVDHGTRVLAPNDCIDTADDTWEEDVISACRDHVGHNAHTSKRLKHKLMNRFTKFGGAMAREIFGYVVPENATTYDDWRRDENATPFILEAARRLRTSLNCCAVADWLNRQGVAVGPYCRRHEWDGSMVRRFFANPLLKGWAYRGKLHTVKHHETGKRVSVKNPKGPQFREYPHLAHLDVDLFDEINRALDTRNAVYKRKAIGGLDPLLRRPRKRTRFPGQHARCFYCGRTFVWGANGKGANLMCSGVRYWRCWNSFGIDGNLITRKIVEAIWEKLDHIDCLNEQFAEMLQIIARDLEGGVSERWKRLISEEEKLKKAKSNVMAAIREFGPRPDFHAELVKLDSQEEQCQVERQCLERRNARPLSLPESPGHLRAVLREKFKQEATDSPEFGDFLRLIAPEIHVYLVRLCDGGHLLPSARVRLNLAGSFEDMERVPSLERLLTEEVTLNLFEPPERAQIRSEAVECAARGLTQRQIAAQLQSRPTATAVWRALKLQEMMDALKISSPYILVSQPPTDYPKLRRHKNPKFRFEPQEGYPRSV